jgi:hypothetical protein
MEVQEILEAITFILELSFEQNYSCWKALDEQEMLVPSRMSLNMSKKK